MALTVQELSELKDLLARAQKLVDKASKNTGAPKETPGQRSPSPRRRRTGSDLVRFRRTLKAERKAGVPVADLARKYGVTASYIYQLH